MKQRKDPAHPILACMGKYWWLSVLCIGLAVAFAVACPDFLGPDSTVLRRGIWLTVVVGGSIAGLGTLFFGPWALAVGYGCILMIVLPRALPEPWNRYYTVVYLLLVFAGIPLLEKRRKAPKTDAAAMTEEDWEEEGDTGETDLVFVLHNLTGRVYQLVYRTGCIYAYRVGGELRGIYPGKTVDPGNPRRPDPKDLKFPLEEIRAITIMPHNIYGNAVKIRLQNRSIRLCALSAGGPETLEKFFRKFADRLTTVQDSIEAPREPVPRKRKEKLTLLNKLRTGLLIAGGAIYLPWLFLKVPYVPFSVAAVLLLPCVVTVCICFRDLIRFDGNYGNRERPDMIWPLTVSTLPIAIRTLMDFNFLEWKWLLIGTGVLAVGAGVALAVCLPKKRGKWTIVGCAVFFGAFYAIGAMGQLNYLLDFQEPEQTAAVICEMHVDTDSDSPDEYIITADTGGKTIELKISREDYEGYAVGDPVRVYTYHGGLGIPYAEVGE